VTSVLLRAAPWPALLALSAAGAVTGVGGLALGRSGAGALLLHIAIALLGGAAACALDEPSAAVVDSCPVRRARRVRVRALAAATPLATGTTLVLAWWARTSVERLAVLQLAGCWLLGFALAALSRRRLDEPGEIVAPGLILALLTVLLVEPVGRRVHLFSGDRPDRTWWVLVGAALLGLLLAVPERPWRAGRRAEAGNDG